MTKYVLTGSALAVVALIVAFLLLRRENQEAPVLAQEPPVKSAQPEAPRRDAGTTEKIPKNTARSREVAFEAGRQAWESGKYKLPEPRRLNREALSADPRSARFRAKSTERWIELAYGAAFMKLNLTPRQVEGMRDLLAKREDSLKEFDALAGKSSAPPQTLSAARQAAVNGIDAEISQLIGADTYSELKSLRQRSGQSLSQAELEAGVDLRIAGIPLNEEQSRAMAAIYAQRKPLSGEPSSETGLPRDLQQMYERARQHLSSQQLAIFLETLQFKAKHEKLIAKHMIAPQQ